MKGNILSLTFGLLWDNGPLCVILAQVSSAVMDLAIKVVSRSISLYAVICLRSFVLLVIVIGTGLWKEVPHLYGPRNHLGLLICRGIAGAAGMILFTVALKHIPIGDANALCQANIIFIIFFSWVFQLERVNWIMAAGVMSCLAGEFLVSQPPFMFGHDVQWSLERMIGIVLASMSALFVGIGYMLVGFMGKSVHLFTLVLWQHTIGLLATAPFLVWDIAKQGPLRISGSDALMLAMVVLGSLGRQMFLTRGLQVSNAVVGMSTSTIVIVMTYALGLIFLDERISILAGIGLVAVMAGIVVVALGKARLRKDGYQALPDAEENGAEPSNSVG